jgi:hypothetical protein
MLRHEVLADDPRLVRVGARGAAKTAYLELPEGWRLAEVPIPAAAEGRPVDPARWLTEHDEVPLVVLRSDGAGTRKPLPPATTPLRAGDALVVLGPSALAGAAPKPPPPPS